MDKIEKKNDLDKSFDVLDTLLEPWNQYIAKKIPPYISPNILTIIGFIFSCLSALLLIFFEKQIALPISAFSLYLWILFDSVDGIHAQATNQGSHFGAHLDRSLDAISALFLYFALIIRFDMLHYLFVFTILLRFCYHICLFSYDWEFKKFYIPLVGSTCEIVIISIILLVSYFFNFNYYFKSGLLNVGFNLNIMKIWIIIELFCFIPSFVHLYIKSKKESLVVDK